MEIASAFAAWAAATLPPPGTFKRYRGAARAMARAGIVRLGDLSRVQLSRYQGDSITAGRGASSVNVEISLLKNVTTWLVERGELPPSFTADLWPSWLPVPDGVPEFYTRSRFEQLREVARTIADWLALALAVACYTGVRRAELRRLDVEDFDRRARLLRIRRRLDLPWGDTKNHKPRVVSICGDLMEILSREAPSSGPLLPSRLRTARTPYISARSLDRASQALARSADTGKIWRTTRSTFATWSLQRDIQPPDVSRALGHSDLELLYKRYYVWCQRYNPAFERLCGPDAPAA